MVIGETLTRRRFMGRTLAAAAVGLVAPHWATVPSLAVSKYGQAGWQIACYTRPWSKYEYSVAFDAIAEAGFKYIGFTGIKSKTGRVIGPATPLEEAQKMGEEARKRGLEIPNAYGGGIPSDQSVEAGIKALRSMIDNCSAAHVWSVMVASLGSEKTYPQHIKVIAECCNYAVEKEVVLVLKPHGGLTANGPLLCKAIEDVKHKNFTVMYDPGNIYFYSNGENDPVNDCAALDGYVTGISVKDYKHPKQVDVTPGTGQVKFSALMDRLRKGGFTHGPLVIECLKSGDLPVLLQEAKKARSFVEQLMGSS
ncbi:MAG: sugar phosphate isomerase/epimerase [Kiritimatiellae bacterium]|nr:sugar phosphate isomerase/epimerase [Kiritimatiellia bacterium]MDD5519194.1 sugar phosphate isomerase/epimerase [Kiritimatiellia bacterium]